MFDIIKFNQDHLEGLTNTKVLGQVPTGHYSSCEVITAFLQKHSEYAHLANTKGKEKAKAGSNGLLLDRLKDITSMLWNIRTWFMFHNVHVVHNKHMMHDAIQCMVHQEQVGYTDIKSGVYDDNQCFTCMKGINIPYQFMGVKIEFTDGSIAYNAVWFTHYEYDRHGSTVNTAYATGSITCFRECLALYLAFTASQYRGKKVAQVTKYKQYTKFLKEVI